MRGRFAGRALGRSPSIAWRLAAGGCALLALACKFDTVTLPSSRGRLAIHAILNPAAGDLPILVERVLTGQVNVRDLGYDPNNPVASGQGQPVLGARVILTDLTNDSSVVAVEDLTLGLADSGVYRIINSPPPRPTLNNPNPPQNYMVLGVGHTFRLEVIADNGANDAVATVTIPNGFAGPLRPATAFNRDVDTLALPWAPVPAAWRYAVQVESPFGPMTLFTDTNAVRIAGTLQNVDVDYVPRAFQPGFQQVVSVAAVDQNYYDYVRSHNDPFSGRGLLNHVQGGVGVVGAYVPLISQTIEVTADPRAPIDTAWVPAGGGAAVLRLFTESRSGNVARLTGSYDESPYTRHGVLGTLTGSRVSLAILREWNASDTVQLVEGRFAGDSIVFVPSIGPLVATVLRPR